MRLVIRDQKLDASVYIAQYIIGNVYVGHSQYGAS